MKKVYIETLGCQMNVADSELMMGILAQDGFCQVKRAEAADLIVFNTCTVREHAVQKAVGRIERFRYLKKRRPGTRIVVAGCLVQERGRELMERLPYVDFMIGPDNYHKLPELLARQAPQLCLEQQAEQTYQGLKAQRGPGAVAWVTIMRGCNNFCSYCIVPYVRGPERSLSHLEIVDDVKRAVEQKFLEVCLLGQNVTSYRNQDCTFAELLKRVDRVPGLKRLRFITSHPSDLSAEIISLFGRLPTLCEHLHLPLQSGSNRILAQMNRGYTREHYLELVEALRRQVPDIGLTTDLMVGFPGESEEDFEQTLETVRQAEFDGAFTFIYSPRQGTRAAGLKEQVGEKIKRERLRRLIDLQMAITKRRVAANCGKELEVLVEGPSKKESRELFGRTRTYKNIIFFGEPGLTGTLVRIKTTSASGWVLKGRRVSEPETCPEQDKGRGNL